MIIDDLVQGLQILRPHYLEDRAPRMRAPEDELNLPPTATPLNAEEVARLRSIHWYQCDADDPMGEVSEVYDLTHRVGVQPLKSM